MKKLPLGLLIGTLLGLLDGLSAIPNPEAQEMLTMIIVSATIKGAITGVIIGLIANKVEGIGKNILIGLGKSTVLSALAAMPSGYYVEIMVPGAIIGILMGFIITKWGKQKVTA